MLTLSKKFFSFPRQDFLPPQPGLERIQTLLDLLGNPEEALPPTIHIAGTNGKGSTLAFLKSLLEAGGYRVHKYTSPHLVRFNERIVLQGRFISEKELKTYGVEVLEAAQKSLPSPLPSLSSPSFPFSWFEMTTVVAFLAFSRTPADVLLLETGMGGRLDATNVVRQPVATLLTSLSLDHQHHLGMSLQEIAQEKAGILKTQVPVITSAHSAEVFSVIRKKATERAAPLYAQNQDWTLSTPSPSDSTPTVTFTWQGTAWGESLPEPPLKGAHQLQNLGIALATLKVLENLFPLSRECLQEGIRKTSWPGRLQKLPVFHPPLPSFPPSTEIWVDGAHNAGSAQALAQALEDWTSPPVMIWGMMKSKNPSEFLRPFQGKVQEVFPIPLPGEEGHPVKLLSSIAQDAGFLTTPHRSLFKALQTLSQRTPPPQKILICGSLRLVGSVLRYLGSGLKLGTISTDR